MPFAVDDAAVDAAITSASSKTTLGAATGASVIGWWQQMDWLGIAGLFVAAVGLAVNAYFQVRRDRREAAVSAARIQALRERTIDAVSTPPLDSKV